MRHAAPEPRPPCALLAAAHRACAIGLVLLAAAGFRHHLIWGETAALGFSLRPWLDAGETACLLGFAWFGARGWLQAIAAVRERSPGLPALLRRSAPLLLLAVIAPPFLSADIADYVLRGRVLALHGGNPYVHVATDFPHDPMLAFGDAGWKRFPLPYGPLLADLQGAVAWLADRLGGQLPLRAQFVLAVVLFKTIFAAALVASALLARGIHRQIRGGDGDPAFVAVLWCPLLLNEALASAHNESLLLLTILATIYAAAHGRAGAAAFALGLGVLVKIVPVLLAPLLLAFAIRSSRTRPLLLGAGAVLGIAGIEALRYLRDPGALDFLSRQSAVTCASVAWAVSRLLECDVSIAVAAGRAAVLTVVVAMAIRSWRRGDATDLPGSAAAVLAMTACAGLAGFGPWYHVWWLPLALLHGHGFLHRFAVATASISPLAYGVWTATRRLDAWHEALVLTMSVLAPAAWALFFRSTRTQRIQFGAR